MIIKSIHRLLSIEVMYELVTYIEANLPNIPFLYLQMQREVANQI